MDDSDRQFVYRAMHYFGVAEVVVTDEVPVRDIAVDTLYTPSGTFPVIMLGKKWHRAGKQEQHKRIAHEFLHIAGYPHSEQMRDLGYYSKPERDVLAYAVHQDMKRHKSFEPRRFGLR